MKIYVLVKEVPDTYGDRKLDLQTGLADRGAGEVVLDEITERALETALSYADKNAGTEVVVLSMAPESSTASVRKALAIGAGSAVHVADEQLRGADLGLTAEVLAAAIRRGVACGPRRTTCAGRARIAGAGSRPGSPRRARANRSRGAGP